MSTEDDNLTRAIALSLEESQRIKKPVLINLDSDEDEDTEETRFQDELKEALRLSQATSSYNQLQSLPEPANRRNNINAQQNSQTVSGPDQSSTGMSAFLRERAQLEKERLERQKRIRPQVEDFTTDDESDEGPEGPPTKRHNSSSQPSTSASTEGEDQLFWNGELRQTATQHAEPRKDGRPTFRLTQVLGKKSDLAFAIMSSYALDFPWIYQFFNPSVPVIMVAQPDASGEATIKNVLPNWIRATPFLRNGYGCQHMKFMLLFYKTGRLRVVISTANLIPYDWRDMENTVWLQDIPLRPKPTPHDPKATDDFASVLQRMLHAIYVKPALTAMIKDNHPDLPLQSIDELRQKWDWSKVKVHLVASIAGKHEGWPHVIQTGHPRLMKIVRNLGMRTGNTKTSKDVVLECQGSSLGSYTTQWMNEFHWSAKGESAEDWLDRSKKAREKEPYPPVKIVFPSKATVKASALGEKGGGTIFCRRKQWAAKNFPRNNFYDSKSKAGPVLMHSKMIIGTLQEKRNSFSGRGIQQSANSDDDDIEIVEPGVGWAYVGSHNFTPSAWGTLSGSSFNPVLNISNYEVGVVFLLKDGNECDRIACFQRPPKKYSSTDEPWMQQESIYHQ